MWKKVHKKKYKISYFTWSFIVYKGSDAPKTFLSILLSKYYFPNLTFSVFILIFTYI